MKVLFLETRPLNGLSPLISLIENYGWDVKLATSNWKQYLRTDRYAADKLIANGSILESRSNLDKNNFSLFLAVHEQNESEFDCIATLSDQHIHLLCAVAGKFKGKYPSEKSVKIANSKIETRKTLIKAGLLQPKFFVIDLNSIEKFSDLEIRYPAVVKPDGMSGGRGVSLVANLRELHDSISYAKQHIASRTDIPKKRLIVEEVLVGEFYSAEVMSYGNLHNILGYTDRLPNHDSFVEIGGTFPAKINNVDEVNSTIRKALDAISFRNGASQVEFCVTSEGPVITEINPRLAGFLVPETIEAATGLDLYKELVLLHSGRKRLTQNTRKRIAVLRGILSNKTGELGQIDTSEIEGHPNLNKLYLSCLPGDLVRVAQNNGDRLGGLVVSAEQRSKAILLADKLHSDLQIRVGENVR